MYYPFAAKIIIYLKYSALSASKSAVLNLGYAYPFGVLGASPGGTYDKFWINLLQIIHAVNQSSPSQSKPTELFCLYLFIILALISFSLDQLSDNDLAKEELLDLLNY